ncbi:MAG: hypothetical protein ACE5KO_05500 [Candidatus Bathyarchaeia archaeon]
MASRFRAHSRPEGRIVKGQVIRIGLVPEHRVTNMILSESGLYLYARLAFRFLHPAVLIPWSEIRFVREIKILWWYVYELDIASITNMRVTKKGYEAMCNYLAKAYKTHSHSLKLTGRMLFKNAAVKRLFVILALSLSANCVFAHRKVVGFNLD